MIYEYDQMLFLDDQPLSPTPTTIELDLRSAGSLRGSIPPELDVEYDEEGEYEGQIYFDPQKVRLYTLNRASLSGLAPGPEEGDLYVMLVPFTLPAFRSETSSYKEVRFFVDFSAQRDVHALDLFPRNITNEVIGHMGYTLSEHGRFQPVDAQASTNLGKHIHFGPLQPVIEAFDQGQCVYWKYKGMDDTDRVEPGIKYVWAVLQVRSGVEVLLASVYWRLLLQKVTKGFQESKNAVTQHQPFQLRLTDRRPFFLPVQPQVTMAEPASPLFDVCLICAVDEEKDALVAVLERFFHARMQTGISHSPRRRYYHTVIGEDQHRLSIYIGWLPGKGSEDTCIEVSHILAQFHPRFMGMTGICAADQKKAALGDLIIAEAAFPAEAGKMWQGQKFEPRPRHWNAPPAVVHATVGFSAWPELVSPVTRPPEAETQTAKVHRGVLASSCAVQADDPFGREHRSVNGAIALDMEGSAFYHTLDGRGIPYLLVKGVSDHADRAKKDTAFRGYAATLSALYMVSFVLDWFSTARECRG